MSADIFGDAKLYAAWVTNSDEMILQMCINNKINRLRCPKTILDFVRTTQGEETRHPGDWNVVAFLNSSEKYLKMG